MKHDTDFCELIIQTIRLEMIYNQYFQGVNWITNTEKGKKISEILSRYGNLISKVPDPDQYSKLIQVWTLWQDNICKENNLKS